MPGAFGFTIGTIIAALGTVILVGPNVARSLRKLKGAGPDSDSSSKQVWDYKGQGD